MYVCAIITNDDLMCLTRRQHMFTRQYACFNTYVRNDEEGHLKIVNTAAGAKNFNVFLASIIYA